MNGTIETLADFGDLCGEGPIWDSSAHALYWTDINGRRFHRYSSDTRQAETLNEGFEVAGFTLRDDGGLVVVNSGGFWLWEGKGEGVLLADEYDGRRCALNDCIADPRGRVLSGSTFFDPRREDYEPGCLFCLDTDGSLRIFDEGFKLSNGLGFSPDERTLYFTDSARRTIYAYDYNASHGQVRNRRVFVRVPDTQGLPDGMTVDAEGYVWSAQWFGGCIVRYDPDGTEERRVSIPATQVTSLAFGGAGLTDMFVTSASHPDALPLAPPGYSPERVYSGGKLFHLNLGITGKNEHRATISR